MRHPAALHSATACTALCALALGGCASAVRRQAPPEPFVFRSLDLRQQDAQGSPAWDLTSPEARYDINRRLAQARQPRGTIYRRGQPQYTVAARTGTVIGDGEAIQLEGDVRITVVGRDPVTIEADQVRWIPRDNLMLIDRRPVATDRRSRLRARTARFLIAEDRVELRGEPTLEQWTTNQPQGTQRAPAPLRLRVQQVDWQPQAGTLRASGVVRGERRDPRLLLTATGLQGNLRQGYVDLQAPVRVVDGKRQGWLMAQQTRWAINDQLLISDRPVRGQYKQLQGQGAGFRVNLADQTLWLTAACQLRQPGEELQAQICQWHWPSGRFLAEGAVVLRRQTYRQITRATRLEGRIGKDGTAVFSSPGQRVQSQFTLEPARRSGSSPRRARSPVVF